MFRAFLSNAAFRQFVMAVMGACLSGLAYGEPESLVDAFWLHNNLTDKQLRVVDVRRTADYQEGHVVGALNIPVDALFDLAPRDDAIAPIATVQRLLSDHGIDNASKVVIYDDGTIIDAARAFWVFEIYGLDRATLLDGGFSAWQKFKLPVSTETAIVAPKIFIPTVRPDRLATKFSTRLAIDHPTIHIIDARTSDEYLGKLRYTGRAGHIPSAVNVPTDALFTQIDGVKYLKSKAELASIFGSFKPEEKIITYCTIGKKSALTYFTLRRLGYNVSNYDGSWKEWGNDPSLPVENPTPESSPDHP